MNCPYWIFTVPWLFCTLLSGGVQGQTKTTTLAQELERIESEFQVKFTYNYSLLGKLPFYQRAACQNVAECLHRIQDQLPIQYKDTEDGNFLLLPERKDIRFRIIDAEAKNPINAITVKINQGHERYVFPEKSVFTLDAVFPLDTIYIASAFYESLRFQGRELIEREGPVQMKSETVFLNEVIINDYVTQGVDVKIADHSFTVAMESLGLLAGETDGDIFNIIKNVPGIHTPSGKPGTLNFRGATWDQTILQLDDIPIYHNGHFFGTISPFNPSLVNTIEIQRNTLHAKWGGRVGGLLNMTSTNKVPKKAGYEVLANTVFGGVNASIPLIKDKLGFYIAGRSNYPGVNSPKLTAFSNLNFQGSRLGGIADEVNSEDFEVGFYDINSKLVYSINNKHKLSLNFIDIQNRLSAVLQDNGNNNNNNNNDRDFRNLDLDNWGGSAKWEASLSENVDLETRFSTSSVVLENASEGFSGNQRSSQEQYRNTINDTRFITELIISPHNNLSLETGYSLTGYDLRFEEQVQQNNLDNVRDQNAVVHSAYVSSKNNWNSNFTSTLGLHADYYGPSSILYVDPRVSLSYRINNAVYLKGALGRSRQFIQKKLRDDFDDFNDQTQFWFLPDRSTAALKSNHGMLGILYNKDSWLIDVETYARSTDNVTEQGVTQDLVPVQLRSLGADIFIKKRWNNLETMLSYSLSETVTDEMQTEAAYFDQRHIFTITALWTLKQYEFAANWGYFSGMPVIIPDTDDMDQNPLFDSLGSRFDSQHQLDVSATYSFPKTPQTWKGIIGISFLNLYDRENIVNIFQNQTSSDTPFRMGIRFSPNLQLRFIF